MTRMTLSSISRKKNTNREHKVLGQIKHSISITKSDANFREVIRSAWNDITNSEVFTREEDAFVLITGPLNTTDINDARTILEWARHSENANEFIEKVKRANFSSRAKRDKLEAFRHHLQNANNGTPVEDEVLFQFLRHFHLLGYDLDIKPV